VRLIAAVERWLSGIRYLDFLAVDAIKSMRNPSLERSPNRKPNLHFFGLE
jgi:hypothetical protein